jgi:hypothetical protein
MAFFYEDVLPFLVVATLLTFFKTPHDMICMPSALPTTGIYLCRLWASSCALYNTTAIHIHILRHAYRQQPRSSLAILSAVCGGKCLAQVWSPNLGCQHQPASGKRTCAFPAPSQCKQGQGTGFRMSGLVLLSWHPFLLSGDPCYTALLPLAVGITTAVA